MDDAQRRFGEYRVEGVTFSAKVKEELEKAVEVLLQKIKDEPWRFPPPPAYPKN